jgi:peptide/nickel transport system substrate-binding protein
MRLTRRAVLGGLAAGITSPRLARAGTASTLKFIIRYDPNILDGHWTTTAGTRNHSFLIWDTLYGLDAQQTPQPQMVQGHNVTNGDREWTLTLRDGLRWHDGEAVLARDCVASLKRWASRDGIGQSLLAATDDISATDDKTIRFRLKRPYPQLLYSLAKSAGAAPFMMPERVINGSLTKPVTELIGSGPFRFLPGDYVPGSSMAYGRFDGYVPRSEGEASGTAGPKRAHFERVEWSIISDPATALATIQTGKADWLEAISPELMPLVVKNQDLRPRILDPNGLLAILRPNHLQPPFDNPAIRRAVFAAIDQTELMQSIMGDDQQLYHVPCGFFAPTMAMASTEGIADLKGPRDYQRAKELLAKAGYKGEKITVMAPVDIPQYSTITETLIDQLKKAGLNAEMQALDFGSMAKRRLSKEPLDKGGWSAFVTMGFYSSETFLNPFTNVAIRGNGKDAWPGWPESPRLEELRDQWMEAVSTEEQKKITAEVQRQAFLDVPYYPMGMIRHYALLHRTLEGALDGFPMFWNVKRAS